MKADDKEKEFDERFSEIKFQSLSYIFGSVFKDYVYKNRSMEQFYEQIREMAPDSADFFVNWCKGFCLVAELKFEDAQNCYLTALEGAEKAKEYLEQFLQQGFALFMYDSKKDEALKFWDFGVQKKVFNRQTEKLFENFNYKEQFWLQFSPKMFVDEKKVEEMVIEDYKKTFSDNVQSAIEDGDFEAFEKHSAGIDFDSFRINGVSVLYYAIQKKGILCGGVEKFSDGIVQVRTRQLFSSVDLSSLSQEMRNQEYFTILHQMRMTFEKSGLARLMFIANNGAENALDEKISSLKKIVALAVEKTSDVDAFVKQIDGKVGTAALHLAAEYDDFETLSLLLKKGCSAHKPLGFAKFGMKYSDGSSVATNIPNSLVYRLINFKSWKGLKLYLEEFAAEKESVMTDKNEKCNITPLVYMILNTIYSAVTEEEFNLNKELLDGFIPLFLNCGSVLEEQTAFGDAKTLLGMK